VEQPNLFRKMNDSSGSLETMKGNNASEIVICPKPRRVRVFPAKSLRWKCWQQQLIGYIFFHI